MSPFNTAPKENHTAPWPSPLDLPNQPNVPHLSTRLIPDAIRPWILDACHRLGVPLEAVLIPALLAGGTVAGNTLRIYPKAHDETWTEAPNLYGLLIAPPSTKKTPAINEGLRFLRRLENHHVSEHDRNKAWRKAEANAISVEMKELEAELTQATDKNTIADLREQHDAIQDRFEAANAESRRYMIMDATVEKTGMLLAQPVNRGGTLTVRDEFSGLLAMSKRSGHENDRAFFLEGYNGTSSYTTDRVSRESITIPVLTLAMLGGIQPTQIEPLIRATRDQQVDDGLLERFQATVWLEPDRCDIGADSAPNAWAIEKAAETFRSIADAAGEREDKLDTYAFHGVHFTGAAQLHVDEWWRLKYADAHQAFHDGHTAYGSHLAKGQAAIARLALIFHLFDRAVGKTDAAVSLEQAEKATHLMDFFHAHARRTYSAHLPPSVDKLRELRRLIERGEVRDGMTIRELQRNFQKLGKNKSDQLDVLRAAEERHWLRLEEVANKKARPSTALRLNPSLQ